MSIMKKEILTGDICHCRILNIPKVNSRDMISIIRYKLTSYYPGSVDDLLIDFIRQGDKVIVFYMEQSVYSDLQNQVPRGRFFSSFHMLSGINDKEGKYYIGINNRLEILNYSGNKLIQYRSIVDSAANRKILKSEEARIVENQLIKKNSIPLFLKKKKRNYLLQILFLILLLFFVPQISLYLQMHSEEQNLGNLEIELRDLTDKNLELSASQQELNELKREYEILNLKKPLNLYRFISDLSEALGNDVEIESLVLKNNSFQMNGVGYKPLEKMEDFQLNNKFQSVLPYQIQSITGSQKVRFSLTGVYYNE